MTDTFTPAADPASQALLQHQDDRGVLTLTLNRPDKRNAFDDSLISQLTDALQQADNNAAVRAVVLTSTGEHFSAGADLNWMKRMPAYTHEQNLTDALALAGLMNTLYSLSKPTLALVRGAAYGGAVGLAACCDMVIAADNASFCLSEVRIGLIPATISPFVLRAIGERQARRYFLTAEIITASKAVELGLAHSCVPADQVAAEADALLKALLGNSPAAISAAKHLISSVSGEPIDQALLQDTSQRIADIRVSVEGQEGLSAFLEKRAPAWRQH